MATTLSSYRRPRGLVIALLALGGIDLLLGLINVATGSLNLAGQGRMSADAFSLSAGLATVIVALQVLLRVPQLVVRALWARRLVRNIHLFQTFPVSPLWAWAGFVVPVVSLWLPGRTVLALSQAYGPRNSPLNALCVVWAIARWLNCLSGGGLIFLTFVVIHPHWQPAYGLAMMLTLDTAGIISAATGLVITPWITRRQPTPDQIHAVDLFG